MSSFPETPDGGNGEVASPMPRAPRRMPAPDLVFALVLGSCGLAALISTSRMRIGPAASFQPRLFPSIVGWLLIVVGGLLALDTWRRAERPQVDWPSRAGAYRIAVVLASLAAQILLIDVMGMPLATFLAVTFQVWYLGGYRWQVPVLTGSAAAAIVYAVFIYGLGLMFPTGLFE